MKAMQGADEVLILAKAEHIWKILEDSTFLPQWAPMVKSTTGKIEKAGPGGYRTGKALAKWVKDAVDFAMTLPRK